MSDPNELTPAPLPGENADDYRRRASIALMASHLDPQRTHVRLDLVRAFAVIGGVVVGVWIVAQGYFTMTERLRQLEERLTTVLTKTDLASLRDDALKATRARLKAAAVRCPRVVARGDGTALCELVWPPEE